MCLKTRFKIKILYIGVATIIFVIAIAAICINFNENKLFAVFSLLVGMLVCQFDSVKEFNFFGLKAKLEHEVSSAEKMSKQIKQIKLENARNYVEQLISRATVNILTYRGYEIDFGSMEDKIISLTRKLEINAEDEPYVLQPLYYYRIKESLEQLCNKLGKELTVSMWNGDKDSEAGASFKCINKEQIQKIISDLKNGATEEQKRLAKSFLDKNREYIKHLNH